jgi:crossover junction endodeoxyribonuclease RusA
MKQSFIVSPMPMNLNKYRNAHHFQKNNEKKLWEAKTKLALEEYNIKPMKYAKITMKFWFRDKRRHDPDNYSVCAKSIFDGMVKAGILKNDTFEEIHSFTVMQGGISKEPYILIELEGE